MSCSRVAINRFTAMLAVMVSVCIAHLEAASAAPCPCDIYEAGGTPCVAAHSVVRALYRAYDGPLYQVRRTSDNQTRDIGTLTTGGIANAAVQDSFLAGKPGTISKIYDQSPMGNHLVRSPVGGWLYVPANESNATDTAIKLNGNKVYGLYTKRAGGYRNNVTKGIATGNKPEGMYMVASGKSVNDSCCFDYGNAETNMLNNGTGTMETIYLGKMCWFSPCTGNGPWVFADLENGLFAGNANGRNSNNTSVPYEYVTAMLKGTASSYTIRAGNAQSGELKTMADSTPRPTVNKLEGAIVLGVGGDNSWAARGIFFEGAMTAGYPPDSTEDAIQKNIIAAGYGSSVVATSYGAGLNGAIPAGTIAVKYNSSSATAVVSYVVQNTGRVRMNVFDPQGRQIAVIVDGVMAAGRHNVVWDAQRIPAGVYVCRTAIKGQAGRADKIVVGR